MISSEDAIKVLKMFGEVTKQIKDDEASAVASAGRDEHLSYLVKKLAEQQIRAVDKCRDAFMDMRFE